MFSVVVCCDIVGDVELAIACQGTDTPTQPNSLVINPVALHHPSFLDSFDGFDIISAFGKNVIAWWIGRNLPATTLWTHYTNLEWRDGIL